jgi:hypothetical protein
LFYSLQQRFLIHAVIVPPHDMQLTVLSVDRRYLYGRPT